MRSVPRWSLSSPPLPARPAAYVREGFSNIRIGMFLEIATTLGAILGAYLAGRVGTHALRHHLRPGPH